MSPRNPFVFLAETEKGQLGRQPCAAAIYRVTRTGSSELKSFDACTTGLDPVWSPDGRQIAWFVSPNGDTSRLFVSDTYGGHFRQLVSKTSGGAVWAPNSGTIAYGSGRNPGRTAVVDVRTGAEHLVGTGWPLAWSPDGKHIALIRQSTVIPQPPGTIVSVPLAGGRSRLLFNVPAAHP